MDKSVMGPRWKGKTAEAKAKALDDPMPTIVEQLQYSLRKSETQGILINSVVLLSVDHEQIELLSRSFFGRPMVTADQDEQLYVMSFEEAFYLCYSLECLKIMDANKCLLSNDDVWKYMKSKRRAFPEFYIAYSHLRKKNWVVSSGFTYGVDFVAYRHHPELVHSEYGVIVDFDKSCRLKDLSDIQCTVRGLGSVAKTLLVLSINTKDCDVVSPSELDLYKVEGRTIKRSNPEHHGKNHNTSKSAGHFNLQNPAYRSSSPTPNSRIQPIEAPLSSSSYCFVQLSTGPKWKGKHAEAKALAYPMSNIVEQLQFSLRKSETQGFLSNSVVLLSVDFEQIELLSRAFFGRSKITADNDKQWYEISFEEAFYLSYSLKCLEIMDENKCQVADNDVWNYMKSKRRALPEFYIAYSYLQKDWVVNSGSKYGADFVAYRHHPELVHSEFVVIVDCGKSHRLKVWSDINGMVRLCRSVKKTLLVLSISPKDCDVASPSELNLYKVEGRTITGWDPKQHREVHDISKRLSSA